MDQTHDFGLRIDSIGRPLGAILLEAGLIDEDQLDEILEIQRKHNAESKDRAEIGEIIANRFGIPRMVIESHFIREQLIFTLKDLFYSALSMDDHLDEDMVIDKTELTLLAWEAEMAETIRFTEEVGKGSNIERKNDLRWVKGQVRFTVTTSTNDDISVDADFAYASGGRPEIDLFAVVSAIKPRLVEDQYLTDDYDSLGIDTE